MRFAIAFLFAVTWTVGQCGGFDYSSACTRPNRSSRGRGLPSAPCDLGRHNYCLLPGNNYPWHAIRRFVRENQGLMRRMYGGERQISIIKAELDNFIEEDDEDIDDENENNKTPDFAADIIKTKMMYTKMSQARAMRDKPHFRPINSDKKKIENDTLRVKPLETLMSKLNNTANVNKTNTNNDTTYDKGISYKTKLESIANIEINNLEPDVITLEAVIKESIETNSIYPKFSSNNKIDAAYDSKNNTESNLTTTDNINTAETTTDEYDSTTDPDKDDWKPMSFDTSTLPPTLLFSEHEKVKPDNKVPDKKEEFHPKPMQHQETVRPAVIKLRGANACEIKEQIAAPFWANSTRGELLALLNMYPYEQFIHLETCVHERKQMYCREGCRCEQQFRFHRLLAYDPRNECRGIFAEWFKFPSCCVCKCYDVPVEFRARSPRILHPQYDENVKRVIYEDVARDWYTLSAYDDDEEDLF